MSGMLGEEGGMHHRQYSLLLRTKSSTVAV